MGRNVRISILNKTNGDFLFESDSVKHGKYQSGEEPPCKINKDKILTFGVGNRTGAKVGPKGRVVYKACQNGEEFKVIFDWDHPFSASTSTYEVASNPPWFGSYYLNPPCPTGHDQELTFVTHLNDYAFDPKEWMTAIGKINPNMKLRDLFIAGSHDSGTYDIKYGSKLTLDYEDWIISLSKVIGASQGCAKAQKDSILDQLNAGTRYLDLRLSNGTYVTSPTYGEKFTTIEPGEACPQRDNVVRKEMKICHAHASADLKTIIYDIKSFSVAHPKEVI